MSSDRMPGNVAPAEEPLASSEREEPLQLDGEIDLEIRNLQRAVERLHESYGVDPLLDGVSDAGRWAIHNRHELKQMFRSQDGVGAFVMSVDVRRSTELMLRAKLASDYATFISTLAERLKSIVCEHHGIFDKFTGDGILASFPVPYSGADAGYHTLLAATACHATFATMYAAARSRFRSVLCDVGLGIGVDYGTVHFVNVGQGVTLVGVPVVYACRMAGGPPGITLLNQAAYDEIRRHEPLASVCTLTETDIEVKHEGRTLAYDARLTGGRYAPRQPSWVDEFAATPP